MWRAPGRGRLCAQPGQCPTDQVGGRSAGDLSTKVMTETFLEALLGAGPNVEEPVSPQLARWAAVQSPCSPACTGHSSPGPGAAFQAKEARPPEVPDSSLCFRVKARPDGSRLRQAGPVELVQLCAWTRLWGCLQGPGFLWKGGRGGKRALGAVPAVPLPEASHCLASMLASMRPASQDRPSKT